VNRSFVMPIEAMGEAQRCEETAAAVSAARAQSHPNG
jgi:hypothetical protein